MCDTFETIERTTGLSKAPYETHGVQIVLN